MEKIKLVCGDKYVLDRGTNNQEIVVVHYIGEYILVSPHRDWTDKFSVEAERLSEINNN